MTIAYSAHGEIAPYLSKYPGLFGFYNEAWVENSGSIDPDAVDIHYGSIAEKAEAKSSAKSYPYLLPPLDLGDSDFFYLKYEDDEGTASSESENECTPKPPASDDWYLGQFPLSPTGSTIRRAPATRISRTHRRCSSARSKRRAATIIPENCDLARLDRLITEIWQTVEVCSTLSSYQSPPKVAPSVEAGPTRHRLHNLRQYSQARSTDLILREEQARFTCPHQLFPDIRPRTHPLRQHPPAHTGALQPSMSLDRALTQLRPLLERWHLPEDPILNLAALLAAHRVVEHLASELASAVQPSFSIPRSPSKYTTPDHWPPTSPVPKEYPLDSPYISLPPSSSLESSPISSSWPLSLSLSSSPEALPSRRSTTAAAAIAERALAMAQLADILDTYVQRTVRVLGLKQHQFTIMKKMLEGCGYLALVA